MFQTHKLKNNLTNALHFRWVFLLFGKHNSIISPASEPVSQSAAAAAEPLSAPSRDSQEAKNQSHTEY